MKGDGPWFLELILDKDCFTAPTEIGDRDGVRAGISPVQVGVHPVHCQSISCHHTRGHHYRLVGPGVYWGSASRRLKLGDSEGFPPFLLVNLLLHDI